MAKKIGFVRTFDDLGRIVIPREVARENGWGPGSMMEVCSTSEGVLIKPFKLANQCYICGEQKEDFVKVLDRHICKSCAEEASKMKPIE